MLLGAIAAWASACGGAEAEAPRRETPVARQDAIAITTAPVVAREVPLIIRTTGTFAADESSDVTPHVSGSVVATLVSVGDRVRAGSIIVRLDDRNARLELAQAQAALQQAEAQAQNARAEASRHGELVQGGDISRSAYEKLTTQVATAEAAVAQARAREALAQKAIVATNVLAPLDGYISERPVAVGEYVTPASKVVTIVRIQPIKLAL
jgi:RND family efflux transporter MFP subunit